MTAKCPPIMQGFTPAPETMFGSTGPMGSATAASSPTRRWWRAPSISLRQCQALLYRPEGFSPGRDRAPAVLIGSVALTIDGGAGD
jgi:hypothetical protein